MVLPVLSASSFLMRDHDVRQRSLLSEKLEGARVLDVDPWLEVANQMKVVQHRLVAGVLRIVAEPERRSRKADAVEFQEERKRANPHGYLYFKKAILPQLREMGVPEPVLNRLCVVGPRNFFEGV